MKKHAVIFMILSLATIASYGQARVGGILGYGSETEQWGLGVNGEFLFSERMAVSPGLFFYFPETAGGFKYSYWELNGNFHYYFFNENALSLYGLAGLNLTTVKVERDRDFLDSDTRRSDSEAGVNLGLGANFDAGAVLPFGEIKYVAGDIDQAVLFLGVKFRLND